MTDSDGHNLGVLAPDSARTILAISEDGELAVAVRDRVDRAFVLVKDVRPDEALEGFDTCLPWPWMVVGSGDRLPSRFLDALRHRPILVFWRGAAPQDLPAHARTFTRFLDLVEAINTALTQEVAGMRLAIGLGVQLPGGEYARSAELQALVAHHPHAFDVPLDAFRSAARVLSTHGIQLRPVRDPASGAVSLAKSGAAS